MAKKETHLPAEVVSAPPSLLVAPGVADDVDITDVVIPRLTLVQKMSKAVDKFGARPGEFRESVSGELLAATPELVFFKFSKSWLVRHDGEYHAQEPITVLNANEPYESETTVNGRRVKVTRDMQLNYYVMVAPVTIEALPLVWTLSSTSRKAGKALNTLFMKLRRAGKSSIDVTISCGVEKNENDKGTWFTPVFSLGRETTAEEKQIVSSWQVDIERSSVKVAESEEDEGEDGSTVNATPF